MKKQQVLATLMAATMIATSAAPAVTTFAAENTAEEVLVGNADKYLSDATYAPTADDAFYGQVPVIKANGNVLKEGTDFNFVDEQGNVISGETLKSNAVSDSKYKVRVKGINAYTDTVYVSYAVKKMPLTVTITQANFDEGEANTKYNPVVKITDVNGAVRKDVAYTLTLTDSLGAVVGRPTAGADTNNTFTLTATVTDSKNYEVVGATDAKKAEAKTTFDILNADKVNKELNVTVNGSVYGANPTVTVPADEKREITVEFLDKATYWEETDKDGKKVAKTGEVDASLKGQKIHVINGELDLNNDGRITADDLNAHIEVGTYTVRIRAAADERDSNAAYNEKDVKVTVAKREIESTLKVTTPFDGRNHLLSELLDGKTLVTAKTKWEEKDGKLVLVDDEVPAEYYSFEVVDAEGKAVPQTADKKDYLIKNAGVYTIKFTAKADKVGSTNGATVVNNFTGTATGTLEVTSGRLQNVNLNVQNKVYDGKAIVVGATCSSEGKVALTYKDEAGNTLASAPVNAGKYTVVGTVEAGNGYAAASAEKKFTISQRVVTDYEAETVKNYNGKKQTPEVTAKVQLVAGEKKVQLVEGKDYDVVVAKDYDGTNVGEQKAELTFKGNYKNATPAAYVLNYKITPLRLTSDKLRSLVAVSSAKPGETPVVTVYAKDGSVIPTADYKVSVTNNKVEGTGFVNIAAATKNLTGVVTQSFKVSDKAAADPTPMYRLYNRNNGEHFFTTNVDEKNMLVAAGWSYERQAWRTPETGVKVYRVYNPNNGGEHHYTTSVAEKNMLVKAGWIDEGIGWYAANKEDEGAVAVYRVYNPNQVSNNHHYTTSEAEYKMLVKAGWKDEGIAFYEFAAK